MLEHDLTPIVIGREEAMRVLGGIGHNKLNDLTQSGDLPSFLLGRRRMYQLRDLEAFADQLAANQAA